MKIEPEERLLGFKANHWIAKNEDDNFFNFHFQLGRLPTEDDPAQFHKLVTGRPESWTTNTSGDKPITCAHNNERTTKYKNDYGDQIGTRCCSLDGKSGASPDCLNSATWEMADAKCKEHGMRLCSVDEISLTSGTGCNFDAYLNWTRDEC